MDTSYLINEPDASRLIRGLRDTGYNAKTAAADIVDNSIAAKADRISIDITLRTDGRKIVYFADNGVGMNDKEVHGAMRYGAPVRENLESLGKFGLGLKTASSSMCLKFIVISRKSAEQPLAKLAWDLDHVTDKQRWEMLQEPVTNDEFDAFDEYCGPHGTLVIWEKCDRILSKDYEAGGIREQGAIKRLGESLSTHLSLVYHRFLDKTDARERDIEIFINGVAVKPWNPFWPSRSEQVLTGSKQKLNVELPDGTEQIAGIRAWILPHSKDLTNDENKLHARISNRAQGFYIYREGRLIQDGSWMGLWGSQEPHTSLLRIEFDFGHALDDAFRIDVKKSRILFHPDLEDGLLELLRPVYREAGARFRRQSRDKANTQLIDHTSANKNIGDTTNTAKPQVMSVDSASQSAVVKNNLGTQIRLKLAIQNNVGADAIHVDAVETITNGDLWQPAMRSAGEVGHVPAVMLNKHHDFYQKIYQRAASNGFAVEGMDLLFYAFAIAEQNYSNAETEPIFEEMRNEISNNLRKLLRNTPDPEPRDSEAVGEE